MYGGVYVRPIHGSGHTQLKRSDIKRRPLADTVLASLEPEEKEYREAYGIDRLYFVVSAKGHKRWEFRYKKPNGKWSWLGLGTYPEVSAKRARDKAAESATLIDGGVDPVQHKQTSKKAVEIATANTFRVAANTWFERKEKSGRADSTLGKIRTYLDKDILPALGDMQLTEIHRKDCAALLASIEDRNAYNVAKKVRGWLQQIFSQAIARGLCENNPASELLAIAAPAPKTVQYPHLLEPELPDFLHAMKNTKARLIARTAAWLTIWTASRPGMVRHAEWSEVDLDAGTWVLDAAKMKMRRDHIVPLPTQAVAALRELHNFTGRHRYLFPGIGEVNAVISENTINQVFSRIGYKGRLVGHGTRHTASTLLREHEWHKDHVEAQLAHKEEGVSGIYNQAAYLRQRREMMQWYADYLDALAEGMTPAKRLEFKQRVPGSGPPT